MSRVAYSTGLQCGQLHNNRLEDSREVVDSLPVLSHEIHVAMPSLHTCRLTRRCKNDQLITFAPHPWVRASETVYAASVEDKLAASINRGERVVEWSSLKSR